MRSVSKKQPPGAQSRVTMRDIAEIAGVSRTTVSHALSGQGRVEASTRERIREIAKNVGFVPSPTALALKTGRTGVLAIVNATTGGTLEYFMLAASAASYEALEAGYTLALVPNESQETWVRQLPMDGAIVLDPLDDDPIMTVLRERGTPVVTIGDTPGDRRVQEPTVGIDRITGAHAVLDHLHQRGARHPALIIDQQQRRWIMETRYAYTEWMHRRDLEPIILDVPDQAPDEEVFTAVRGLVQHADVDAAYVPFGPMAAAVLAAIADLQLEVPRRFRIVSQEGIRARTGRPTLTALDDRPDEVARLAMHALIERLTDPGTAIQARLVQPSLIVRQTT